MPFYWPKNAVSCADTRLKSLFSPLIERTLGHVTLTLNGILTTKNGALLFSIQSNNNKKQSKSVKNCEEEYKKQFGRCWGGGNGEVQKVSAFVGVCAVISALMSRGKG